MTVESITPNPPTTEPGGLFFLQIPPHPLPPLFCVASLWLIISCADSRPVRVTRLYSLPDSCPNINTVHVADISIRDMTGPEQCLLGLFVLHLLTIGGVLIYTALNLFFETFLLIIGLILIFIIGKFIRTVYDKCWAKV